MRQHLVESIHHLRGFKTKPHFLRDTHKLDDLSEVNLRERKSCWDCRKKWRSVRRLVLRQIKRRKKGETMRQWTERNLQDAGVGVMLDLLQSLMSIITVFTVVQQNWMEPTDERDPMYHLIDQITVSIISVCFVLRLYAACDRLQFFIHWLSVVDLICILPTALDNVSEKQSHNSLLRMLQSIRVVRVLQLYRLLRFPKSAKVRQGIRIGLTAICIIICAAAGFQLIEYKSRATFLDRCGDECNRELIGNCTTYCELEASRSWRSWTFFNAMYFVSITIGTVGFGEYAPKEQLGKVFAIVLIIFTGILIPSQISGYTEIANRETVFDKKYKPEKHMQHVLLCGEIEYGSLRFFLDNWLHVEGERVKKRRVVILAPTLPSATIRRILIDRENEQRVTYLQGSALVPSDLRRACAESAAAIFILVRKHSSMFDQNDTAANLITCAVRKCNRYAPVYVQVSKQDNARHMNISGATGVVCLEQLRLGILARSCWMKGVTAFVSNLIQRCILESESSECELWFSDYLHGCVHSIYEARVPTFLFNLPSFQALVLLLYREFGVIAIGTRSSDHHVTIFPKSIRFGQGNAFDSVFFIGKSRETVAKIERMCPEVLYKYKDISPTGLNLKRTRKTSFDARYMKGSSLMKEPGAILPEEDMVEMPVVTKQTNGAGISHGSKPRVVPIDSRASDDMIASGSSSLAPVSTHGSMRVQTMADMRDEESHGHARGSVRRNSVSDIDKPVIDSLLKKALSYRRSSSSLNLAVQASDNSYGMMPSSAANNSPPSLIAERRNAIDEQTIASRMSTSHNGPMPTLLAKRRASPARITPVFLSPPATLHGHYVVCGLPSSYVIFFGCLHEHDESVQVPVVFVTEKELTDKDFAALRLHQSVYFVRGSSVSMSALYESRMLHAKSILIFAGDTDAKQNCSREEQIGLNDEHMADVEAITTHQFIRETWQKYGGRKNPSTLRLMEDGASVGRASAELLSSLPGNNSFTKRRIVHQMDGTHHHHPHNHDKTSNGDVAPPGIGSGANGFAIPHIVVEMMRPNNVKFLLDRSSDDIHRRQDPRQPHYAKGIVLKSTTDQGFYSPLFAAGNVFFSNIVDALMGSCVRNAYMVEIMALLITGSSGGGRYENAKTTNSAASFWSVRSSSRFGQIPVPFEYQTKPFGELVEGLLQSEGILCLGLYRNAIGNTPAYVLINPPTQAVVAVEDLLFVLR